MGCIQSVPVGEEVNPRIFKVVNVDDLGHERNPGRIEISDCELIWYQRGKEPIRWPLKSLRRYGFDAELFSFESGRRCPTGPGIYAFKCRRAEALFNLLQDCIQRQRNGQDEPVGTRGTGSHGGTPSLSVPLGLPGGGERGGSMGAGQGGRPSSLVQPDPSPQGSPHPAYINGGQHAYVNTNLIAPAQGLVQTTGMGGTVVNLPQTTANQTEDHVIQYAELDLNPPGEEESRQTTPNGQCNGGDAGAGSSQYVNLPAPGRSAGASQPLINLPAGHVPLARRSSLENDPHNYANIGLAQTEGRCTMLQEPLGPKMTYIQLELMSSSDSIQPNGANTSPVSPTSAPSNPDSPTPKPTDMYAKIDFDRTRALNAITADSEEEGARKTRHNSNIDELH